MRAAGSWNEAGARRAMAEGRPWSEVLETGLPWASELLADPLVRALPEGDREDAVQAGWLRTWQAVRDLFPGDVKAWCRLAVLDEVSAERRKARADRRRGRSWEESRGKGENAWP